MCRPIFRLLENGVTKKVPTGEKKKGLFGGEKEVTKKVKEWKQTGFSDRWIDGERLSNDVANAVKALNEEGYEVVAVIPVISGEYSWARGRQGNIGGYGYGYGYSYTEGVSIIAKKNHITITCARTVKSAVPS